MTPEEKGRLRSAADKQKRQYVMTFGEIGEELGLSHFGVEKIYLQALEKFRRRMGPVEDWFPEPKFAPPSPIRIIRRGEFESKGGRIPPDREHRYPDWSRETTRVVSGPVGDARFPGTRFETVSEAREHWTARSRIRADYTVTGRYIFRVDREDGQ